MDETTAQALDRADEAALRRVRGVATLMDEAVRVPGTQFKIGLDPVLGAIPGAGDLAAAGVSLYIVAEAAYLGVPLTTVVKMLATVAVDTAVGSIPVVGFLFDTVWKTNAWNVAEIEAFLGVEAEDVESPDEPVTIDVSESQ